MANPFDGFGDLGDMLDGLGKTKHQRAEDALRQASDHLAKERAKEARANAPLPQIRAKRIEGVWFLRSQDVLAALEAGGAKDHPLAKKLRALHER